MAIAVIPARLASTRFPRKLLADRTGKPLIVHVVERAREVKLIDRVIVATDHADIERAVRRHSNVEVVMTSEDHPNGTSRLAEAARKLKLPSDEIIVNVQGDEPEIEPAVIDRLIEGLRADADAPMATLASDFADDENPANPNIVKLVVSVGGRAMYFSRSLIPCDRDAAGHRPLKHPGLYAYRVPFLETYIRLSPTPLEQIEKLEQLRVLEHGYAIAVIKVSCRHHGIDTAEQYDAFVERWNRNQRT